MDQLAEFLGHNVHVQIENPIAEVDIKDLAAFMGHDIDTHTIYYRRPGVRVQSSESTGSNNCSRILCRRRMPMAILGILIENGLSIFFGKALENA